MVVGERLSGQPTGFVVVDAMDTVHRIFKVFFSTVLPDGSPPARKCMQRPMEVNHGLLGDRPIRTSSWKRSISQPRIQAGRGYLGLVQTIDGGKTWQSASSAPGDFFVKDVYS